MKKPTALGFSLFLSLLFILFAADTRAQNTQIKVTGIRSSKGKIALSVFRDSQSFKSEKPYKNFLFDKKDIAGGSLTFNIQLEPGTYGIALLDDENSNSKMDKSFIGIPKEGFGFSDFYMEKLKKPAFDDFKVDLKAAHNKAAIRVKYL